MDLVETTVKAALERAGYIGSDTLLVVAVSGGADSMALLHSLLSLSESAGLRLHVAHLNHNFRGDEAEEDARFVSEAASHLGLPATVDKADPMAYKKETGISSFEEAAREVRYRFLGRVARDSAAAATALGHTADDLAETVLMHIIRGSGIHGLRGMSELSSWRSRAGGASTPGSQEAVLFRPLLAVTKGDTVGYCQKRRIAFRDDPGNRLPRFTRNRVRHELLPALASFNPRIGEALVRLAHSSSLEADFLEEEVTRVWPSVAKQEGDSILFDAGSMVSLHPIMQRMVMRRAYRQLTGDTRRLEEVHLKKMAEHSSAKAGKVLDLPRGLRLSSGYGQLVLAKGPEAPCPLPPLETERELLLPQGVGGSPSEHERITEFPGWQVAARLLTTGVGEASSARSSGQAPFAAYFDLEALVSSPRVRARLPGDRFQPLGMQSEKKLQDFFVDAKVPRAWRDGIPLVVCERGIAWVVGYRVAEWARPKEDSKSICRIQFSPTA